MAIHKKEGGLTNEEKRIVKALLAENWRNQDIQALNTGRAATINCARITGVKKDANIKPATADEVAFYKKRKQSYDWNTGLNLYDNERLIRSREAMILAVHVFNSPSCQFKTEVFAVLVNIAWTCLLHEFYDRKKVRIVNANGRSPLLSQMLARDDCPLSPRIVNNLKAMKTIRDDVEHLLLGRSDLKWASLFQACCLNFDATIVKFFGEKLPLQSELSFALQFSKLNIDQINAFQNFEIPEHITALDARLRKGLTDEQLSDIEYQLSVIYTLNNASKSTAGVKFIKPDSEEAKDIKNVLLKYKIADEEYPYKPGAVARLISKKTGKTFLEAVSKPHNGHFRWFSRDDRTRENWALCHSRPTGQATREHLGGEFRNGLLVSNNTQAWNLYKVRPKKGNTQPANANKEYCIYHAAHADYTYSEKWIDFLSEKVSADEYAKIKAVKV